MFIFPLILFAFFVVIGLAIGVGVNVFFGAWPAFVFLFLSVLLLIAGIREIREGNRSGDGGLGDCVLGVLMVTVAIASWIGFAAVEFGWTSFTH